MQTHCRIANGTIVGFDGGLMAGCYTEETLRVCPHTKTLIAALSKCEGAISITELDSGRLSIKSGKFNARVPCIPFEDIPPVSPDNPCATLTDDLKAALRAVLPLADHTADRPAFAGVLVQAGTVATTNGAVLLEAWHGIDLPPILLPKASAEAICKNPKKLTEFGFSHNSASFFYEDGSFIKTQLFENVFPDYKRLLDVESNPAELPEGFYEAIEKVMPFAEEGRVYFIDGKISSHPSLEEGASYAVAGIIDGIGFSGNFLKIIKDHFKKVHFNFNERGMNLFFNETGTVRGGIMKVNF
jgi:DNA polymerase III sliding clamp (beta) subunit (PCNA family)